jgi:acyl carrier protein
MDKIVNDVNTIMKEIFKDQKLVISRDTRSSDIEKWDSLSNMHLIVAIEDHYKIRFALDEIQFLKNVGELYDCVSKYINK